MSAVLLHLLLEHLGIDYWMSRQECLTKTSRESCRDRIFACDDTGHVSGVSIYEMVHALEAIELGYRRQDSVGVTAQENDVFRVASYCWDLDIWNKLKRVGHSGVGGNRGVIEIHLSVSAG